MTCGRGWHGDSAAGTTCGDTFVEATVSGTTKILGGAEQDDGVLRAL